MRCSLSGSGSAPSSTPSPPRSICPIVIGGGGGELEDPAYLAARGVRVALQGHQPFMAAVKAVHDTLKALRDGVKPAALPGIASAELMKAVTRDTQYKRWMGEFLSRG